MHLNKALLFSLLAIASALSPNAVLADRLPPDQFSPKFTRPPVLKRNPNSTAPLVVIVEFETAQAVYAELRILDDQNQRFLRVAKKPQRKIRFPVLGLKAARDYTIDLYLRKKQNGNPVRVKRFQYRTPHLPADFPPLTVLTSKPEKMEPGVTMFNVYQWVDDRANEGRGYIIAVDAAGDVVWFFRADHPISDVKQLANGNLLYLRQHRIHPWTELAEIDMEGNLVRGWFAGRRVSRRKKPANLIRLNVDTLHHDVVPTGQGTFRAITTEVRRFSRYPTSEQQPNAPWRAANVVGDVIVEFQPGGKIVKRWPLLNLLDPTRLGYGSLGRFWDTRTYNVYAKSGGTRDWSHANALDLDRNTGSMIVSVRHQDAIIKIDGRTGKLAWILANPSGWKGFWRKKLLKPVGTVTWPYHQHAPKLTSRGTLLVYDNGNYRAPAFQPKLPASRNATRVVEYAIDESAMTVRQVWEYRGEPHYCPLFGDADDLKQTGNVLITDGGLIADANNRRTESVPGDRQWARILEVSRKTGNEKVFELRIGSNRGGRFGWSVYRSERLRSLYPPSKSGR